MELLTNICFAYARDNLRYTVQLSYQISRVEACVHQHMPKCKVLPFKYGGNHLDSSLGSRVILAGFISRAVAKEALQGGVMV